METTVKVGDKFRPTQILADQPEPKYFVVMDIFPEQEMLLIKSEDGYVKKIQFWFLKYCKKLND
jgi:hypothetical protein